MRRRPVRRRRRRNRRALRHEGQRCDRRSRRAHRRRWRRNGERRRRRRSGVRRRRRGNRTRLRSRRRRNRSRGGRGHGTSPSPWRRRNAAPGRRRRSSGFCCGGRARNVAGARLGFEDVVGQNHGRKGCAVAVYGLGGSTIHPLRKLARLTALIGCIHEAGLLELMKVQLGQRHPFSYISTPEGLCPAIVPVRQRRAANRTPLFMNKFEQGGQ
jgi:hypothetical protein